MCHAFSCVIGKNKKVWWEFGIDSHEQMIQKAGYQDDTKDLKKIQFARIEISPKNLNYLDPDQWMFKIDMDVKPAWWIEEHEKKCWRAFQKWKKQLDKTLPPGQKIIHPFREVPPITEVTEDHIKMLKDWASVRASMGDSVWDSVGASVRALVGALAGDSARASVGDSVRASVAAYTGSFFRLPRAAWKYSEKVPGAGYPFQSTVDLWMQGLVPSYDGKKWRLHTGPDGHVVWEGELPT